MTDLRGKELLLAVEFESGQRREAVHRAAFERDLLSLPCGHRTLRVLPPLDARGREITIGAALLERAAVAVA